MDHHTRSTLNYFTTRALNRLEERRADEAWIEDRLHDSATRFIPVWRDRVLLKKETATPITLTLAEAQPLIQTAASVSMLGLQHNTLYFGLGLAESDEPPAQLTKSGQFQNLRRAAALLREADCALLTYAKGMAYWHHHHRFCSTCGSPTTSAHGGSMRVCSNPECLAQHFPLIKPAIIVLVTSGERCLLGRKPEWPTGLHSTIAGFVEPAESLEAAVVREVYEETRVKVASMRYFASQTWPFPNSLMLAFTAQAASQSNQTIQVEQDELEAARWFTRQEIYQGLEQGTLQLPLKLAISFHLIEHWFDASELGPLREIA